VKVQKLSNPIVLYSIGLAAEYRAESLPKRRKRSGTQHAHLIKRMLTYKDPNDTSGFARVTDEKGRKVLQDVRHKTLEILVLEGFLNLSEGKYTIA